jgi:hypothetical protein
LELFIEVLSVVRMILGVKQRWSVVMPLDPLLIRWSKHAIVSVLLYNHLDGGLGVSWIGCTHARLLLEDTRETLTSKR